MCRPGRPARCRHGAGPFCRRLRSSRPPDQTMPGCYSSRCRHCAESQRPSHRGAPSSPGPAHRLKGMLTDRDIVVKCIAVGGDPATTKVAELAEGKPVTIGADDSVEEALRTMKEHGVRRLPVIDGHELIGIVSQADVARNLPEDKIGDLVEAISSAPSNS